MLIRKLDYDAGGTFSTKALFKDMMSTDFRSLGTKFQVPIIIIQAADDTLTLVKEYYASIDAPRKELVVIPHADHPVSLAMPALPSSHTSSGSMQQIPPTFWRVSSASISTRHYHRLPRLSRLSRLSPGAAASCSAATSPTHPPTSPRPSPPNWTPMTA